MLESLRVEKEFEDIFPKRSLTKIKSMDKPGIKAKRSTEVFKLLDSCKKLPKVGMGFVWNLDISMNKQSSSIPKSSFKVPK
jgi:hypothetical protein